MGTCARRILVTGGTGFSGRHLSRLLVQEGARVTVLSSTDTDSGFDGVQRINGDIRDSELLRRVVDEVRPEEVYHLAAVSSVPLSWNNPRLVFEVNVAGTFNVLEAAMRLHPAPRVLNVSTGQVYASSLPGVADENSPTRPDNPYAASKAMAELLSVSYSHCSQNGGVITARPFNHTGPGQSADFALPSFAKQIAEAEAGLRKPLIQVGDLDVERDFTDVRDVVRAYRLLLQRGIPGEVYNICSGESRSMRSLLEMLCSLARVEVKIEVDPVRLRQHQPSRIVGAPNKLQNATGWTPTIPFRSTLQDLLDWWRMRVGAAQSSA